jgi:predicted NBD/HSP70 family sugar kinase
MPLDRMAPHAARRMNPAAFRIARRGTPREINRQISLNLVREKQPISRSELARLMGLRPGAVSLIVNELLDTNLIVEGAKGASKGGRRPTHLHIDTRRRSALAVDISASITSIQVTDVLGHPLMRVIEFPTGRRPQVLVTELGRRLREILADRRFGRCAGVGVVVSGVVDFDGRLTYSPTLGWRNVDLVGPLRAATNLPVTVENSVKACILAQVWAATGDAPADGPVAFVNISDGVGVGIAIDGKLLRGAHNIAGEFGHVTLDMHGPRCSCGQNGCWEAYVAKRAITARYRPVAPVEEIVARARKGDGKARHALNETGYYIGRGLAMIVKAIDPRRIYVGGEITEGWDLFAATVQQALREQSLIRQEGKTEIRVVPLGEHPRLLGAVALVSTPTFAAPTVA